MTYNTPHERRVALAAKKETQESVRIASLEATVAANFGEEISASSGAVQTEHTIEHTTTEQQDGATKSKLLEPPMEQQEMCAMSCRRCRSRLFVETDLSAHQAEMHALNRRKLIKDLLKGTANGMALGVEEEEVTVPKCTSYFLAEAPLWLPEECEGVVQGKLLCFKCSTRLGSFSWSGAQCSCGTWVTPSFQIPKSKVDIRMVKFVAPTPRPRPTPETPPTSSTQQEEEEVVSALESMTVADEVVHTGDNDVISNDNFDDERSLRERLHLAWLDNSREANIDGMMAMVDETECSLLTVRKVSLDGPAALRKALEGVKTKFTSVSDPVVGPVQLPSGATRLVVCLPGKEEGTTLYFGEAIWWSPDDRVQHVSRKKLDEDTYESYVQG